MLQVDGKIVGYGFAEVEINLLASKNAVSEVGIYDVKEQTLKQPSTKYKHLEFSERGTMP